MFDDFKKEHPKVKIKLQKTGGKYHDRYIAIDYGTANEAIYHCGSASKNAVNKITTISKLDDGDLYHPICEDLREQPELRL